MKKFAVSLIAIASIALFFSCQLDVPNVDAGIVGYEEFKANVVRTVQVEGKTRYLIDGDILTSNEADVRAFYDAYVRDAQAIANEKLSVHVVKVNGKKVMDLYNQTTRYNLTFTIDPSIRADIAADLEWALNEWEKYAGVDFKNVTGQGVTPVFVLRNATAAEEQGMDGVIASAFFPSYAEKELLLFDDFYELFSNGGTFEGWDSKAVLLHELGHGIGLRHEFIWTKYFGRWWQTGEWTATAWLVSANRDDYSIMYYPQYDAYKGDGRLSAEDKAGVAKLYPKK
jgi:hypothetical protein